MQIRIKPQVSATPAADSSHAEAFFGAKLGYETDCADVHHDMTNDVADFVLVDVRSEDDYARGHVPGAVNIPNGKLNRTTLAAYPDDTLFVVYCWGPGCNGATKGALKLSAIGRPVKEMIGGFIGWEQWEGYPVERGAS